MKYTETQQLRGFYRELRDEGLHSEKLSHDAAIRMVIARVFVSPSFLYRLERPASGKQITEVTQYELAARLSYFLWSSAPDEALLRAASADELRTDGQLKQQIRRMLDSPKSRRLAAEFFGQWLGFYRFKKVAKVDAKRFPQFTLEVQRDMHEEAVSYFEHIVRNDRPIEELLFSDYTFLTKALAEHYEIHDHEEELTNEPTLVESVDRFQRGGAIRLGAILTLTSRPLRTSPVKRGDYVLRRILGTPPPPPPPGINSLDEVAVADEATIRDRLAVHRDKASCAECHARIDPIGFALENYDRLGRWRDKYEGDIAIDASGTMLDGQLIDGPSGLREHLKANRSLFHRVLAVKLLGYALGRNESLGDQALIGQMMDGLERDTRVSDLVEAIVTSRQFRSKRGVDYGKQD